jgi:hypothetical protein
MTQTSSMRHVATYMRQLRGRGRGIPIVRQGLITQAFPIKAFRLPRLSVRHAHPLDRSKT